MRDGMQMSNVLTSTATAVIEPPMAYPMTTLPASKAQIVAARNTAASPHAKRVGAPRRGNDDVPVMRRIPKL